MDTKKWTKQRKLSEERAELIQKRYNLRLERMTVEALEFISNAKSFLANIPICYEGDIHKESFWVTLDNLQLQAILILQNPAFDSENRYFKSVLTYYNIFLFMKVENIWREPQV